MMKVFVLFIVVGLAAVEGNSMTGNFQTCNFQCSYDGQADPMIPVGNPTTLRGKAGRRGAKGQRGEPGVCDPSGVEDLRRENAQLKREMSKVQEILNRNRITMCGAGMQDYRIKDEQITASSEYPPTNPPDGDSGPRRARLFSGGGVGHWASRPGSGADEWVQVDMIQNTKVVGVVTQGCYSYQWKEYLTTFYVLYRTQHSSQLKYILDDAGESLVFQGNTDKNTPLINEFPQPVTARYFRIMVRTYRRHPSLRMELLLC